MTGLMQEASGPVPAPRPPLVLTLQSQVVLGHVGNSAAVFPMQAAGLEVSQIPTVLFSNTPFYPSLRGHALPPALFADLLLGAQERGLTERAAYLVTGYLGSLEVARLAADFVARAKALNPELIYLCDPVMGDLEPGLYVPAEIAAVIRDRLLPLADIVTPNPFELAYLTGQEPPARLADIPALAGRLGLRPQAHLVATGCALAETATGAIETLVLGPAGFSRHPVLHQPVQLAGTGDLFAGLLIAGLAHGRDLAGAVEAAQIQMSRAIRRSRAVGAREVMLDDPAFRRGLLTMATPGPVEPAGGPPHETEHGTEPT